MESHEQKGLDPKESHGVGWCEGPERELPLLPWGNTEFCSTMSDNLVPGSVFLPSEAGHPMWAGDVEQES